MNKALRSLFLLALTVNVGNTLISMEQREERRAQILVDEAEALHRAAMRTIKQKINPILTERISQLREFKVVAEKAIQDLKSIKDDLLDEAQRQQAISCDIRTVRDMIEELKIQKISIEIQLSILERISP